MSNKAEIKEYIVSILEKLGCRGIKEYPSGNLHCQCPFHSPRRNITAFGVSFTAENLGYPYNCQSCGEKGNLVQLLAYADGISYQRAIKRLNKSITLAPITISKLIEGFLKLKELSKAASEGLKPVPLPPRNGKQSPMVRYMEKRRQNGREVLNCEYIIKKYGLYYCGEGWYAGRIIMPIRIGGTVVGINDRAIDDSISNKSLHTAGQSFGKLLHGLDEAIGKKVCVIVEGAFDMFQVASAIQGDRQATQFGVVANIGTAFSDQKAALILENFEELVIMFDHDQKNSQGKRTGPDAANKVEWQMKEFMPVRNVTCEYPLGKDPGICTKAEILTALYATGYQHSTRLSSLKNSRLSL